MNGKRPYIIGGSLGVVIIVIVLSLTVGPGKKTTTDPTRDTVKQDPITGLFIANSSEEPEQVIDGQTATILGGGEVYDAVGDGAAFESLGSSLKQYFKSTKIIKVKKDSTQMTAQIVPGAEGDSDGMQTVRHITFDVYLDDDTTHKYSVTTDYNNVQLKLTTSVKKPDGKTETLKSSAD